MAVNTRTLAKLDFKAYNFDQMKLFSCDVGLMNNPKRSLSLELKKIADNNFSFIDLVLEPPKCLRTELSTTKVNSTLKKTSLFAVGHTWYDHHFAHPTKRIRDIYLDELKRDIKFFKKLGCTLVAVHPDANYKMLDKKDVIQLNIMSLKKLSLFARKQDLKLLLENITQGAITSVNDIRIILKEVPSLGLLLDVNHANAISKRTIYEFFEQCGPKIEHLHLSDNNGKDEHLPIGQGTINWKRVLSAVKDLKQCRTITLEVYARNSSDQTQLKYQLQSLQALQSLSRNL